MFGRGTGVREKLGLMGRFIEAEKEVIIIATRREKVCFPSAEVGDERYLSQATLDERRRSCNQILVSI